MKRRAAARRIDPQRRLALQAMLAAVVPLLLPAPARAQGSPDAAGTTLAPWQPGWLDIHHLAIGRGNATLVIFPDGTSLLIDAGAASGGADVSAAVRPDATRRAGEWVGRYVQRHLRGANLAALDYLLATHLHPDHVGDVSPETPAAPGGAYQLTGIADVAQMVKVGTLIDRGFPRYDYPSVLTAPFAENYRAFVKARVAAGGRVEQFKVGSAGQIAARGHRPGALPFEVRNVAANGKVWTGHGDAATDRFPPLSSLAAADQPTENGCSTALRIGYGRFGYFTGGDLTSYTDDGALPWRDVLGPAAQVAGPVSVATADHHGMFDGLNGDVVRSLRPRAWVVQAWHLAHPDMLQMERMLSTRLYPGARDVFATNLMQGNFLANERLARRMASREGHVVVRVPPGGAHFYVAVTDHRDEADRVKSVTPLYPS
jgi:glyoxylase-like metal-dependent hydrolase (beta-lactamase superfamily II)